MIGRMKHLDLAGWLYGLGAAVIGGGSSSVSAAIGAAMIDPGKFNLAQPSDILKLMLVTFAVNAVLSLFLYLKQSPLPPVVGE